MNYWITHKTLKIIIGHEEPKRTANRVFYHFPVFLFYNSFLKSWLPELRKYAHSLCDEVLFGLI